MEKRRLRCINLVKQKTADEEERAFAGREPYHFTVDPYVGTIFGSANGQGGTGGRGHPLRHPGLLFEYLLDLVERDTPTGVRGRRFQVTDKCM
eukprot:gene3458-2689_t